MKRGRGRPRKTTKEICREEGCIDNVRTKGLCSKHYFRHRRAKYREEMERQLIEIYLHRGVEKGFKDIIVNLITLIRPNELYKLAYQNDIEVTKISRAKGYYDEIKKEVKNPFGNEEGIKIKMELTNPRRGIEGAFITEFVEPIDEYRTIRLDVKEEGKEEIRTDWYAAVNSAKVAYGHRWQQPKMHYEKAEWRLSKKNEESR